jgi:MFS family permease
MTTTTSKASSAARSLVLPLALAQFIASYAATNMNVAISSIASDLNCSVSGIQATITLFTLTMAALMIPGSKLTDIWGRKTCFVWGLVVYGAGALLAALAQGLPLLIVSYSLLEGIGSALMIPPIYILITVAFDRVETRAKYFGVVSGAAGLGAAAGPLIGGLVTSAISWRASFALQFIVVALVIVLARKIQDPPRTGAAPHFDLGGAVLSALGLFFVVFGVLQSSTYGWTKSRKDFTIGGTVILSKGSISPVWLFFVLGLLFLAWCVWHLHRVEKAGSTPLVSLRLFHNRTSNLGLATQTAQWLVMQGTFFVVSVYLQEVHHYSAIKTGLTVTPATIGILLASALAGRMATRRPQALLIRAGFVLSVLGMIALAAFVRKASGPPAFLPGMFLMGLGIGMMLTASVNVVQSSFPPTDQGDISGVSRSVSNLGSSLGVALAGSVLVGAASLGIRQYSIAITILGVVALLGLVAALLLPKQKPGTVGAATSPSSTAPAQTTQSSAADEATRAHPA